MFRLFKKKEKFVPFLAYCQFSPKLWGLRTRGQALLEEKFFLKRPSYFKRLKFNIQLFYLESTTTSVLEIRKAFLLFLLTPASMLIQAFLIMEYFYSVFVRDMSYVLKKRIRGVRRVFYEPYILPEIEGHSTTFDMNLIVWRLFTQHYLLSYEFVIFFISSVFISYFVLVKTSSTEWLHSAEPEESPTDADPSEWRQAAAQLRLRSSGDIAYLYEYKRAEMFIKSEIFLCLLLIDAKVYLQMLSREQAEVQAAKIIENLESYLEEVAKLLLQIQEYDALLLKNPSVARSKSFVNLKHLYRFIYDFETSENVALTYEALRNRWIVDGEKGMVDYLTFEIYLESKYPDTKETGKLHPYANSLTNFSESQEKLRQEKNLLPYLISRRPKGKRENHKEKEVNIRAADNHYKHLIKGAGKDESYRKIIEISLKALYAITIPQTYIGWTTMSQKDRMKLFEKWKREYFASTMMGLNSFFAVDFLEDEFDRYRRRRWLKFMEDWNNKYRPALKSFSTKIKTLINKIKRFFKK